MNKLTFPRFQNQHTFLTSMTPSGSIPSGPPCSLMTRILQLENIPFPSHLNYTLGESTIIQPVSSGHPPLDVYTPPKAVKEAGGARHLMFCARQPKGRQQGTPRKGPTDAGPSPQARAPALPSQQQTVSRELHALSSAPYTAQAGVIDAGRGLARAMPTVRRDPVAGAVPSALRPWRAGAAVTLPPPHLKSSPATRAFRRK